MGAPRTLRRWLRSRFAWSSAHDEDLVADRDKAAAARAAIYLLGGGGLLGIVSQIAPGAPGRNELLRTVICLAAMGLGVIAGIGFDRLPGWFFNLAPAAATVLITADLLVAGGEDTALPYLFLVALYALNFLDRRAAFIQVVLIGAGLIAVAALRPGSVRPDKALVTLGVLAVGAYVIVLINGRLHGLVAELGRSKRAITASRRETIYRLSRAAEFRDEETGLHTRRISEFCFVLARELGLGRERAELIRLASALHDIGKIAIPDRILLKPGPLTEGERAIMQEHTQAGFDLLTGSGQHLLDVAAMIALSHHERYDGTGYPHGLAGESIPLEGRIVAVADVFDATTSNRPYRAAEPIENAVEAIRAGSGTLFDPEVVSAFMSAAEEIAAIRLRHRATGEAKPAKAQAVA